MGDKTGIEWTDATWNPVRGCDEISSGCALCYAKTFAERFRGVKGHPYEQGFDLKLVPHKLNEPLKWTRPRMIFVNSMSDLFHEGVPDDYIIDVTKIMVKADWHVFQVLTKRSERERDMLNTKLSFAKDFRHIWWGVSCENKNQGVPRIAHLQAADVRVRIISFEPLLEDLGELNLKGIHWGIGGGESGGRANFPCRPCDIQWLRNLRDQCVSQGVPYFLKQLGGHPNKRGGDEAVLDGRRWTETPELSKL